MLQRKTAHGFRRSSVCPASALAAETMWEIRKSAPEKINGVSSKIRVGRMYGSSDLGPRTRGERANLPATAPGGGWEAKPNAEPGEALRTRGQLGLPYKTVLLGAKTTMSSS